MTPTTLLALALLPTIAPPPATVSWEKRCDHCPQRFYDECRALNLAGLPLRCQQKSAEEVARLREALRCAT